MEIDFYKIRNTSKGQRDAFESLVCSLFHKQFENNDWEYQCYRGDGGDGGVEAIFVKPDGTEIGVQAKFWENNEFGSPQITQLTQSFKTAIENHPNLKEYYVAIPFDLTGNVASGKRGKSQIQKFEDWRNVRKKECAVEIILWTQSNLRDILLKHHSSEGFIRYWFDSEFLTEANHKQHVQNAAGCAGKRYSPELNVRIPLYNVLKSFLDEDIVIQQCKGKEKSLKKDYIDNSYFKEAWGERYSEISKSLISLEQFFASIKDKKRSEFNQEALESFCKNQIELAETQESLLLDELQRKFGDKFVDNERFRQFQAQYMCDFPAAKLDKMRDYQKFLGSILDWVKSEAFNAAYSKFLIIKGPAGIGKTHSIMDFVANTRYGLHYVFFGESFCNSEPWIVIRDNLGFSGNISKDYMFEALDAQAENQKCVTILFIDALNESKPRSNWKRWLQPLINDISRYPNLKLCVSCRDTYLTEVFEETSKYFCIEHNGFAGQQQAAIKSFFNYYKLKDPIYPLVSEEFSNPLFLHLFCQSFQENTFCEFPKGRIGLNKIFGNYIQRKNQTISTECGLDADDNLILKSLEDISKEMALQNTRSLSKSKVKEIVQKHDSGNSFADSLFLKLETEGLLSLYYGKSDDFGVRQCWVRFTYERMADYFIALNMLNENKHLEDSLQNNEWAYQNKGVLEILAIILPEKCQKELPDFYPAFKNDEIWFDPFVASLPWRSNDDISDDTISILMTLLRNGAFCEKIWLTLISMATVPESPLNINFFENNFLLRRNLCDRDPIFSFVFRQGYENKESVYKLIDLALNQKLEDYDKQSLRLWSITLCWFLANPDRRIRDKSSKGLVRVLQTDFEIAFDLIRHFKDIDDEYIIERLYESIYAAVLLLMDAEKTVRIAAEIIRLKILKKYENVIIHDACRLIIYMAHSLDKSFLSNEEYLRQSCLWTNKKFEKVDETTYLNLIQKKEFKSRNINFVGYWYTDFQNYILGRQLDKFDLESGALTVDDIYKWFVVKLSELGYPGNKSKSWLYDSMTLDAYGFDRMRKVYAERLTKKYYWILLHRLIGLLQNTVPYKKKKWDNSPDPKEDRLHSLSLRQIDLTDFRYYNEKKYPEIIINTPLIELSGDSKEWKKNNNDFFNPETILFQIKDINNNAWIPLHLYKSEKISKDENDYSFRESCILVSAYIVKNESLLTISTEDLADFVSGSPFDSNSNEYQLYLGEYPLSRSYEEKIEKSDISELYSVNDKIQVDKTSFDLLRGNEWSYDCSNDDLSDEDNFALSEPVVFPSKAIIGAASLTWDNKMGWQTPNQKLAVFQDDKGLFIRKDILMQILGKNKSLLFNVYREKVFSDGRENGIHAIRCAYKFDGKKIEPIYKRDELTR